MRSGGGRRGSEGRTFHGAVASPPPRRPARMRTHEIAQLQSFRVPQRKAVEGSFLLCFFHERDQLGISSTVFNSPLAGSLGVAVFRLPPTRSCCAEASPLCTRHAPTLVFEEAPSGPW